MSYVGYVLYTLSYCFVITLPTLQMKEEEKWPVFQPSPKMDRKSAKQQPSAGTNTFLSASGGGDQDPDSIFEEMSGMVTLKRKPKEKTLEESFDNHPGLQSLF